MLSALPVRLFPCAPIAHHLFDILLFPIVTYFMHTLEKHWITVLVARFKRHHKVPVISRVPILTELLLLQDPIAS